MNNAICLCCGAGNGVVPRENRMACGIGACTCKMEVKTKSCGVLNWMLEHAQDGLL